jgi:cytochrome P450
MADSGLRRRVVRQNKNAYAKMLISQTRMCNFCIRAQLTATLSVNADDRIESFAKRYIESTATDTKKTLLKDADFDREELAYILRDLFGAGEETVSTTLRWVFLVLANHPCVQTRLQKEVDDVIGTDRQPSLNDQSNMPYTQAVILETMRRHTLAPLSILRETTCDTRVDGYFIPKDTTVRIN